MKKKPEIDPFYYAKPLPHENYEREYALAHLSRQLRFNGVVCSHFFEPDTAKLILVNAYNKDASIEQYTIDKYFSTRDEEWRKDMDNFIGMLIMKNMLEPLPRTNQRKLV